MLARHYGCDICYTPMILADSFCMSEKARNNEFTTNAGDTPLVVQFAAKSVADFVGAAHMVVPYSDGVELNCGCPQRWAIREGYGCALLHRPELIAELIKQCRAHVPQTYTISAKIRLLNNIKDTVELCRGLEKSGISYITVHGRTPGQRSEPVNIDAIRAVKQSLSIPVIANGDIRTTDDATETHRLTGCDGVMVARGMLANPAMFEGHAVTPWECVQRWVDICYDSVDETPEELGDGNGERRNDGVSGLRQSYAFPVRGSRLTFQCFHHHLVFMTEKLLTKSQRQVFNNLNDFASVTKYLEENFDVRPQWSVDRNRSRMLNVDYRGRNGVYVKLSNDCSNDGDGYAETKRIYDSDSRSGSYFDKKLTEWDENDGVLMKSMFYNE